MKNQSLLLRLGGVFRFVGIPTDKGGHFVAGAIIALGFGAFFGPCIGLAAAVAAGACKEWRDSTGRGHVEFLDFLATAAGGAVAFGGMALWA